MTDIFISHSDTDANTAGIIAKGLRNKGYGVISLELEIGVDISKSLKSVTSQADIFVVLLTNDSIKSKLFIDEYLQLNNYTAHSKKILIPIFEKGFNYDSLPMNISNIKGILLTGKTPKEIKQLVDNLDTTINVALGKKLATDEKAQVIKDKIESSAPEYINETIIELNKREKNLNNNAVFWYILGFASLISGVIAALIFASNGLKDFDGNTENWSKTTFFAIKSVVIIILLISASKYSFNLAKSYMNESLKISDRIHAISFGKFYLQVYNQQIEPNEMKEIFQNWNINNESSFIHQKTSDFDPQFLEKIIELIDKVKNNKSA